LRGRGSSGSLSARSLTARCLSVPLVSMSRVLLSSQMLWPKSCRLCVAFIAAPRSFNRHSSDSRRFRGQDRASDRLGQRPEAAAKHRHIIFAATRSQTRPASSSSERIATGMVIGLTLPKWDCINPPSEKQGIATIRRPRGGGRGRRISWLCGSTCEQSALLGPVQWQIEFGLMRRGIRLPPAGSQANVWTASAPSAMANYRF